MTPGNYAAHPLSPGQSGVVQGTVLANRAVGSYRVMTFAPGPSTHQVRPGHRIAVAVGGSPTSWLSPRSLWVTGVVPDVTEGSTLEVAVCATEPGSRWLAEREPGTVLPLVVPVGRPFPQPTTPVGVVLAGEGLGCAPLLWLGQALRERGCHVSVVLAATDAVEPFGEGTPNSDMPGCTVVPSSTMADAVATVVSKSHASVVYGCAGWTALEQLHLVGDRLGVNVFVALSEQVGCGVGLCGGCVLPIRGKDGLTRMVRGCVEGPVFRSERVRWDAYEDGWCMVPPDAVGAMAMGWSL